MAAYPEWLHRRATMHHATDLYLRCARNPEALTVHAPYKSSCRSTATVAIRTVAPPTPPQKALATASLTRSTPAAIATAATGPGRSAAGSVPRHPPAKGHQRAPH